MRKRNNSHYFLQGVMKKPVDSITKTVSPSAPPPLVKSNSGVMILPKSDTPQQKVGVVRRGPATTTPTSTTPSTQTPARPAGLLKPKTGVVSRPLGMLKPTTPGAAPTSTPLSR